MPNMTLLSGGRAVRCYLHEATPATSRIPADMAPTPLADAPLLDVRSLHAEHGRGSSRVVAVRDVSFSVGAGTHRVRFDGRLSKHRRLAPDRYTLIITATDGAGQPATKKLTFTIVSA